MSLRIVNVWVGGLALSLAACTAVAPTSAPPAPTATPVPARSTTPPGAALLFADDFEQSLDPRWTQTPLEGGREAVWISDAGRARVNHPAQSRGQCAALMFGAEKLDLYQLSFELGLPARSNQFLMVLFGAPSTAALPELDASAHYVQFRYTADNSAYLMSYSQVGDSELVLTSPPTMVQLEVRSQSMRLWVNGERLYDYGLPQQRLAGALGFIACMSDTDAQTPETTIDNVRIESLP